MNPHKIYLIGLTLGNGTKNKTINFKKLTIPFDNHDQLEKFRFDLEQQTPGKRIYLHTRMHALMPDY